jgi:hypothetical protein
MSVNLLLYPDHFLAPVLLVHRALRCSHYVGSETLVSLDSVRSRRARVRKSSIIEHEAVVSFHAVKHIGMPSHAFQPGASLGRNKFQVLFHGLTYVANSHREPFRASSSSISLKRSHGEESRHWLALHGSFNAVSAPAHVKAPAT